MSALPGWSSAVDAYGRATDATWDHSGCCSVCAAGGTCGTADELMDAEYRRAEEWRRVDPAAVDAYVHDEWRTALREDSQQ